MPRKKTTDTPGVPPLTAVPKPKITRATKATKAVAMAPAPTAPSYEEIAEAAYLRFLDRGGSHGADFDDWLEAERELTARRGYAKAG